MLVVAPTPGMGGEGIARDVLRAMGNRFDLPQTPRDPATLLARAELWLLASRREALTIDDATAHVLLAVLRGRRDERSWNKLEGRRPAAGRAALRRGATQRP